MKVRAGESFNPSSRDWNRFVDAANAHERRELLARTGIKSEAKAFVGKVSGTITAGSDSGGTRTPGSGTVALYYLDSDDDLAALTDAAGTAFTVTAYNWTTTASGTDAWVFIQQDHLRTWWFTNEAC